MISIPITIAIASTISISNTIDLVIVICYAK